MPRNPQDSHWRRVLMTMIENAQIVSVAWSKITGAPTYYPLAPGSIAMWPTSTPPASAVLCNGQSLLRAGTYASLFAVIGTTFGAADGTHFNVPNYTDYSPIGAGNLYTVGTPAGALTVNIQHTHDLSNHIHDMNHSHPMPHTHDLGNHTHDLANHTHTGASHTHDLSNHAHHVNASTDNDTVQSGTGKTVSNIPHAHGNTDGPTNNTSGSTAPGAGSIPSSNTSGTPSSNTSGAVSTGNTGASESGGIAKPNTGVPSTNTSGNGLSTTQSILHPVQPAYFIIYY